MRGSQTAMSQTSKNVSSRRLGLPWVSAADDLLSVRKALASGLFSNAAQYVSTTVERGDKEHTGVDMYHLVRSTGSGQSSLPLLLCLENRQRLVPFFASLTVLGRQSHRICLC